MTPEPIANLLATELGHLSHIRFSPAAAAAVSIPINGNARCAKLTFCPSSLSRDEPPCVSSGSLACSATAACYVPGTFGDFVSTYLG